MTQSISSALKRYTVSENATQAHHLLAEPKPPVPATAAFGILAAIVLPFNLQSIQLPLGLFCHKQHNFVSRVTRRNLFLRFRGLR